MEQARDNGYKLHRERFCLGVRKYIFFFTVRTIPHWNNLTRDAVESLSLEVFRMQLDSVI